MQVLSSYLPNDRRHALAHGLALPERTHGTALFADVSGFTALTATFARTLGARRGAEELTHRLNALYDTLIGTIAQHGGSVVGFSGDALSCWFDDAMPDRPASSAAHRALRCAVELQAAMMQAGEIVAPDGSTLPLRLKIGLASGAVRRFVVGDSAIQQIDVLAGTLLDRMAEAERLATGGEIVVDEATTIEGALRPQVWRIHPASGLRYAVVETFEGEVAPAPWPALSPTQEAIVERAARAWLLPPVRERLERGQEHFLAELRPALALFLAFGGIDYDNGATAGEQLDAFVRSVQQVLQRYGGSLIQLTIGDKGSYGYAVWGAPVAHDDDRGSAIEAAHALLALPAALHFVDDVRIGLAQGVMWTGAYGSAAQRTYGVMGDKTNLAARLMQHAARGTIACDEEIVAHLRQRWRFEPLPPLPLKTPGVFANAYRALGAQASHPHTEQSVFIGRRAEVDRVLAALQAVSGGTSRVVLVEGEAGIGKSRFLREIGADVVARGVAPLTGAGRSIEQHTPYRAWRDIFARMIGIEDEEDIATRTARVAATLASDVPASADRLPLLREFLNLDAPDNAFTRTLEPAQRSENLDRLLVDLLRARAMAHPLAIILEDAHWLDSRSWELAGRMARTLADHPLLLLVASRPMDDDHIGNDVVHQWAALPNVERITLAALDATTMLQLAATRLGVAAVPPAIGTLLHERAGGNPFFAEELIAALQESGFVRVEHDPVLGTRCHTVGDLDQMRHALPATLQGLILSRIDRLPWDKQLTLKVASVIGPRFGVAPLLFMRNIQDVITPTMLDEHLHDLTTRDFTQPEVESDPLYRFRHILTQEAAYQMLLFVQRRALHRMVAEWYEHAYGDDETHLAPFLPLLAFHYRYAEDAERERTYARLAGQQAARQYANAEAADYFGRALHLTPAADLAARFDLLMEREAVYNIQGARAPQRADLDLLSEIAEHLDDDRRRAEVALRRAYYAEWTGDFPAMTRAAEEALPLAETLQWTAGQAMASLRLGRSYVWRCLFDQAQAPLHDALRLARGADATDIEAETLRSLGLHTRQHGNYQKARQYFDQALQCFRSIDDRSGQALVLNNLGIVSNEEGDNRAARRYYEQALHLMSMIGDRRGEAIVYCNLGMIAQDEGDIFGARLEYERSLALNLETHDRYSESVSLANLASTFVAIGDYTTARTLIDRSLHLRVELGDREGEAIMWSALANVLCHTMRFAEALPYAERSLAQARDLDLYLEQVDALMFMGHALCGLGRWPEALDAYTHAWTIHSATPRPGRDVELRAYIAYAAWHTGDTERVAEHIAAVVPYVIAQPLDYADSAFRVYNRCYELLKALDDPRAPALAAVAYNYLQRLLAAVTDPQQRAAVENVPLHRATAAAFSAEHGEQP